MTNLRLNSAKNVEYLLDCFISTITTRYMLEKDCEAYLTYVIDSNKDVPSIQDIPIVREYSDCFS